ncbi:hypothetical protein TPHA_0I00790 [Tetrapisispora phaffii CBS 4417]|uniref:Phospholipase n=1 Tax=Tetrapisispora phaffii (strain ATCC 24235 / CBS 4417 / NBRC 1672 / NRRL Y-8282 / UCD 70-5) TaxID=1071381 RepID=G8BXF7_TETPH|nr:hypothetical protein TPHA_0I00790 [Tetrapisispora phaffii CBS 4417]CCE64585.1 hypothetical protein TPHA_0I00790 [Tetrapisispora phaffii CBS 4417]
MSITKLKLSKKKILQERNKKGNGFDHVDGGEDNNAASVIPNDVDSDKSATMTQDYPNLSNTESVDAEAELKNVTFQGIPNSVLKANLMVDPQATTDKLNASKNSKKVNSTVNPLGKIMSNGSKKSVKNSKMDRSKSVGSIYQNSSLNLKKQLDGNGAKLNPAERRRSFLSNAGELKLNLGNIPGVHETFQKIQSFSTPRTLRPSTDNFMENKSITKQAIAVEEDSDLYTRQMASDLINTMLAGTPAALFASTQFMRDERHRKRAPLLLAMLGVSVEPVDNNAMSDIFSITSQLDNSNIPNANQPNLEIQPNISSSSSVSSIFSSNEDREYGNTYFRLKLEYGVGKNRMKWSIIKSYKELAQFNARLRLISFHQDTVNKLHYGSDKTAHMHLPRFPKVTDKETFHRHRSKNKSSRDINIHSDENVTDENASLLSTNPSINIHLADRVHLKHLNDSYESKNDINLPMHIRLQRYLRLLNVILTLRPQANRLFQFYEFSPISNLLSYENSYKGKEGYMVVRSTAKAQGWRVFHFSPKGLKDMVERHTNKWFLVRESYIMYVADLYSNTPLDVFLVDSNFKVRISGTKDPGYARDMYWNPNNVTNLPTKFMINLENGERKLQLITTSDHVLKQWMLSILFMAKSTVWTNRNRFGSFAPIRKNAYCKFLVDGRDYFWSLSKALMQAEDVIYIHDWWLSPELYMRRPLGGNQKYRLDRILKERAENGVKIFIVVYRNVGGIVGTDSLWTKHSMLRLHPNIHIIRSPNQWIQNTYFWAHHEKMTVIDNSVAFMGGIDLCYGRYDTPDHALTDNFSDLKDQFFPGKDYSNARICDFFGLDKPFESMYDREGLPRMPWHDVQMVTVGESARDMGRHFVQRWNYLIRQKRPSRPTPLLTPPVDFKPEELINSSFFHMIKNGASCETQVLRSAGNWSLGLKETEKSIQNAYLKLIETSEHYIYIENQFFVTTSRWDGVVIENKIGDAIIDRIIRASSEGKVWKAFIIIPLMPGFDSPVDRPEASSLRVIIQCQYQSISRGESSIMARLQKLDIDPTQYIQFFSLRKWSTIGNDKKLITEQLYVHAKLMIVDDRSCIIGSANINERSQAGNRDSEVAILIRDTDLIKSKMGGKHYMAGKFALELRQRLMREHLGCDVDLIDIIERKFQRLKLLAELNCETLHVVDRKKNVTDKIDSAMIELGYREVFRRSATQKWLATHNVNDFKNYGLLQSLEGELQTEQEEILMDREDLLHGKIQKLPKKSFYNDNNEKNNYHSFNYRAGEENVGLRDKKNISTDPRLTNNIIHDEEVAGLGADGWKKVTPDFLKSVSKQLQKWSTDSFSTKSIEGKEDPLVCNLPNESDLEDYITSDSISSRKKWDMLKRVSYLQHLIYKKKHGSSPGKVHDEEVGDTEDSLANHRKHSIILEEQELDDEAIDSLLSQISPSFGDIKNKNKSLFQFKFLDPYSFNDPLIDDFYDDLWFSVALKNTLLFRLVFHCQPDNAVQSWSEYKDYQRMAAEFDENQEKLVKLEETYHTDNSVESINHSTENNLMAVSKNKQQARAKALKMNLSGSLLYGINNRMFDKYTAKRLLERIQGHLVIFPTEWLAKEIESKNWFYNTDRLTPIDIYD